MSVSYVPYSLDAGTSQRYLLTGTPCGTSCIFEKLQACTDIGLQTLALLAVEKSFEKENIEVQTLTRRAVKQTVSLEMMAGQKDVYDAIIARSHPHPSNPQPRVLKPSTLNPHSSSLIPHPSSLNPQPSINPQPPPPNPQPSTLILHASSLSGLLICWPRKTIEHWRRLTMLLPNCRHLVVFHCFSLLLKIIEVPLLL